MKTGSQLVWRPDQLGTRWGRESQHPAEGVPRPPVEQPWRTRKKRGYGHKSGDEYVAVLFGLQLLLTHKTFLIKWEVYVSKNCVARLYCAWIWLCIQHFMLLCWVYNSVSRELLWVGFCWSFNTGMSIWRSLYENVHHESVFPSPAMPRISCSTYLDCFIDRRWVAVRMLFSVVLLPVGLKRQTV